MYRLNSKKYNKGSGGSGSSHFRYITRTAEYQPGIGIYGNKEPITASFSMNMPDEIHDQNPEAFWIAVDKYERANSRIFRGIVVSLPRQFNIQQQKDVCHSFVKMITRSKHPTSVAIHPGQNNDNPHAHIMICERELDNIVRPMTKWFSRYNPKSPSRSGAKKVDLIPTKRRLLAIRRAWQFVCNRVLVKMGSDRVSCKSLKAQGIDRTPQVYIWKKPDARNHLELFFGTKLIPSTKE